jgi:hypothetical protein
MRKYFALLVIVFIAGCLPSRRLPSDPLLTTDSGYSLRTSPIQLDSPAFQLQSPVVS